MKIVALDLAFLLGQLADFDVATKLVKLVLDVGKQTGDIPLG